MLVVNVQITVDLLSEQNLVGLVCNPLTAEAKSNARDGAGNPRNVLK